MNNGVVLVVDDEVQIRDILSFYLKRAGYQVLVAENGAKALEVMEKIHVLAATRSHPFRSADAGDGRR